MKTKSNAVIVAAVILLGFIFAACDTVLPGDKDTGAVEITIGGDRTFSIRTITGVDSATVVLSHEVYPSLRKTGEHDSMISFSYVKAGTWTVQVYLDDTTNDITRYYGEGTVEVVPGETSGAVVTVYATGGVGVDVEEGFNAPSFENIVVDSAAQTITVDITLTEDQGLDGATIKYTTNGNDPRDETTSAESYPGVVIGYGDTLQAVTYYSASGDTSDVTEFAYGLPLFSEPPGTYEANLSVSITTLVPGATIRYTTDGSTPTYLHGTIGGAESPVLLTEPASTLKAVSFMPGDPDSVSDVASAVYTLTFSSDITVYLNFDYNSPLTDGVSVIDWSPSGEYSAVNEIDPNYQYITIVNDGTQVLSITDIDLFDETGEAPTSDFDVENIDGLASPHLLEPGEEFRCYLEFIPRESNTRNGELHIYSSDPDAENVFEISLTGEGNYRPTLKNQEGFLVEDADDTTVNGFYAYAGENSQGAYFAQEDPGTHYIWAPGTSFDLDSPYASKYGFPDVYYRSYIIGTIYDYSDLDLDPTSDYGETPSQWKYVRRALSNNSSYTYHPWGASYEAYQPDYFWGYQYYWKTVGASGTYAPTVSGPGGDDDYAGYILRGSPVVGKTLSVEKYVIDDGADSSEPDSDGPYTVSVQWQRRGMSTGFDWEDISGATSETYTVQEGDYEADGMSIRAKMSVTAAGGVTEGATIYTYDYEVRPAPAP